MCVCLLFVSVAASEASKLAVFHSAVRVVTRMAKKGQPNQAKPKQTVINPLSLSHPPSLSRLLETKRHLHRVVEQDAHYETAALRFGANFPQSRLKKDGSVGFVLFRFVYIVIIVFAFLPGTGLFHPSSA